MIPEAAVEAAAEAAKNFFDGKPPRGTRAALRLALEAAAPHMLAEAWEAGEEAGQDNAASNRGFDVEHKYNPYRPTP